MGHGQVGSVSMPDDNAELSDVEIASCHSTHEDFCFDSELNPSVISRCSRLACMSLCGSNVDGDAVWPASLSSAAIFVFK